MKLPVINYCTICCAKILHLNPISSDQFFTVHYSFTYAILFNLSITLLSFLPLCYFIFLKSSMQSNFIHSFCFDFPGWSCSVNRLRRSVLMSLSPVTDPRHPPAGCPNLPKPIVIYYFSSVSWVQPGVSIQLDVPDIALAETDHRASLYRAQTTASEFSQF